MKIAYLALVFFGVSISAYGRTGNDLLKQCEAAIRAQEGQTLTQTEQFDSIFCMGFIEGASDTGELWQRLIEQGKEKHPPHFCVPDLATDHQLILVIVKWLKENPERLHEDAVVCIHNALLKAFPCH